MLTAYAAGYIVAWVIWHLVIWADRYLDRVVQKIEHAKFERKLKEAKDLAVRLSAPVQYVPVYTFTIVTSDRPVSSDALLVQDLIDEVNEEAGY